MTRPLAVICHCGGQLETSHNNTPICTSCKRRYTVTSRRARTSGPLSTDERILRAGYPLRTIEHIERGFDGGGMWFHLECGHQLNLQRRHHRFSQKRARCPFCPKEDT